MSKQISFKVILITLAIVVTLLTFSGVLWAKANDADSLEKVKAIHDKHTNQLLTIKGVEGTAIGFDANNHLSVKIFAAGPKVADIPKDLDGIPTEIIVTGKFRALRQEWVKQGRTSGGKVAPTSRFPRPVPIGVSTGNAGECSAGTIGCRVKDTAGNVYALSNNHVYALENEAEIGSEVAQPGVYDTGCSYSSSNVIGTLADFVWLEFNNDVNNYIDAAIALSSTANLGNATPSNGYGKPRSAAGEASLNQKVQKYGRTTSLTRGTVTGLNASIWITYDSGAALFTDQIIVQSGKPFIKAGDSGSLLVTDPGRQPVGLLFAGDTSGKYAIANRIMPVLDTFGVTVDGE